MKKILLAVALILCVLMLGSIAARLMPGTDDVPTSSSDSTTESSSSIADDDESAAEPADGVELDQRAIIF